MLVYLPVVVLGFRQIVNRRAVFNLRVQQVHFIGTPAVLFGLGQLIGGLVSVFFIGLALQNANILWLLPGVALGALIAMTGFYFGTRAQINKTMGRVMNDARERIFQQNLQPDDVIVIEADDADRPAQPPARRRDDEIIDVEIIEDEDDPRTD